MNGRCWALVLGVLAADGAFGESGFLDRTIDDDAGSHRYVIYVPPDYTREKNWPVVLFLHGSGERGTDNRGQIAKGLAPAIKEDPTRCPAIAIFPQAESKALVPANVWFPDEPDGKRALAILDRVCGEYVTDPDRVYLTGLSMGGYGTWGQAMADPGRWAALVPICGGGSPAKLASIAHIPTWCFHGSADPVVPAAFSRLLIKRLEQIGGAPRYTEYPGVLHNSWDKAYREPELYSWLFAQKRGPSSSPAKP
jgi:predicted peptidase